MIPKQLRDTLPEGAVVEVLLLDLTLSQAHDYLPQRASWWDTTELPVRHAFHMGGDEYWAMTVAEHAAIAQYLHLEDTDGG